MAVLWGWATMVCRRSSAKVWRRASCYQGMTALLWRHTSPCGDEATFSLTGAEEYMVESLVIKKGAIPKDEAKLVGRLLG